jgi:protease-4
MGTYGASGGYWVSSAASAIIADPSTLTGSIGVFGGKLVVGPALAKWGVDARDLTVGGQFAGMASGGQPMTPAQRAAFSAWMDRIYDGFVGRVAQGRRLPKARVAEIARGRVWTGAQAKSLGLVDELGGFYEAVERAKTLGGITGEARLQTFGAGASPLEALQRALGLQSLEGRILASLGFDVAGDPELRAVLGAARDARLRAEGATVLAPEPFR